ATCAKKGDMTILSGNARQQVGERDSAHQYVDAGPRHDRGSPAEKRDDEDAEDEPLHRAAEQRLWKVEDVDGALAPVEEHDQADHFDRNESDEQRAKSRAFPHEGQAYGADRAKRGPGPLRAPVQYVRELARVASSPAGRRPCRRLQGSTRCPTGP